MHGHSDIASMARKLYPRHRNYGFEETPFCKDPLAVIVNAPCPITLHSYADGHLHEVAFDERVRMVEDAGPAQVVLAFDETGPSQL